MSYTLDVGASSPRHVTITRVFQDGIELNWIPPKDPNGDILCYVITYAMQNGTIREVATAYNINYLTLTGMVKGHNYFNISVVAFNGKPGKKMVMMTRYVHNPNTTLPCDGQLLLHNIATSTHPFSLLVTQCHCYSTSFKATPFLDEQLRQPCMPAWSVMWHHPQLMVE